MASSSGDQDEAFEDNIDPRPRTPGSASIYDGTPRSLDPRLAAQVSATFVDGTSLPHDTEGGDSITNEAYLCVRCPNVSLSLSHHVVQLVIPQKSLKKPGIKIEFGSSTICCGSTAAHCAGYSVDRRQSVKSNHHDKVHTDLVRDHAKCVISPMYACRHCPADGRQYTRKGLDEAIPSR